MSQGTLSDMLGGRRAWSKSAIVKLADYFKLSTDIFLRRDRRRPS
jgi:antitoxin component HigA of HigAB toxin-antitoxin module